ncbi:MAG: hypothetical protein ACLPTZ_25265 [Beijerinckiaceae bacterium]
MTYELHRHRCRSPLKRISKPMLNSAAAQANTLVNGALFDESHTGALADATAIATAALTIAIGAALPETIACPYRTQCLSQRAAPPASDNLRTPRNEAGAGRSILKISDGRRALGARAKPLITVAAVSFPLPQGRE